MLESIEDIEKFLKSINCFKDGFDKDGVQLWSRNKGLERILTNKLVKDGRFIVRFNKVLNTFHCPAGMVSLIGCPISTGYFEVKNSPALISLEGIPKHIAGASDFSNSDNINVHERHWYRSAYSNKEKNINQYVYNDYWEDYYQWLKISILSSNLPIEYLKKLADLDIVEESIQNQKKILNKANSEIVVNKFNL